LFLHTWYCCKVILHMIVMKKWYKEKTCTVLFESIDIVRFLNKIV